MPLVIMAVPILIVLFIYLIIRGIIRGLLRYSLESKKIEAGYYLQPAQHTPQSEAARVRADLVAERAYRKALLLIILGVLFCVLPFPFLFLLGGILLILGIIRLIHTILFDDEAFISRIE